MVVLDVDRLVVLRKVGLLLAKDLVCGVFLSLADIGLVAVGDGGLGHLIHELFVLRRLEAFDRV